MVLTDDYIKATVEAAFRPLRCVVKLDYDVTLSFRVFDANNKGVLRCGNLPLDDLRDEERLKSNLLEFRERLKQRGFRLEPLTLSHR